MIVNQNEGEDAGRANGSPEANTPDRITSELCRCLSQHTALVMYGARNPPRQNERCETDANCNPLNDGYNWKGDPNTTTLPGQSVPRPQPGARHRPGACAQGQRLPSPPDKPAQGSLHRVRRKAVHPSRCRAEP